MCSGLSTPPGAAAEAHELLLAVLAVRGRRVAEAAAAALAQMIMAANAGVALSMITRPELCPDPGFPSGCGKACWPVSSSRPARLSVHTGR
jgi:hypothetical protein